MVVSRLAGRLTPMMILTDLPVENLADAQRVLRYYARRWECEEGIRFLKSQVLLEKIRTPPSAAKNKDRAGLRPPG